jgi:hypothetical protein
MPASVAILPLHVGYTAHYSARPVSIAPGPKLSLSLGAVTHNSRGRIGREGSLASNAAGGLIARSFARQARAANREFTLQLRCVRLIVGLLLLPVG